MVTGYSAVMTTAAVTVPFADATPAQIRGVLLPEELPRFEREYSEALRAAAEQYRLDRLETCLRTWRRIAWLAHSDPGAHRRMLAHVEHTLATGEPPPGSVAVERIEELIARRLGR